MYLDWLWHNFTSIPGWCWAFVYLLWLCGKAQDAAVYRWSQQIEMLQAIVGRLNASIDATHEITRRMDVMARRRETARKKYRNILK